MKTSFKAVRAVFLAVFVFVVGFVAEAQRVRLLQLERYLGQPIPNRAGYVGLTDTLGDQYYHKLDSIIGYIADSISQGLDTDEQYFDTAMIVNDTLILSIIRDGLPAHRISLTAYTSDDQTLSYDHASNTLSISGGNSVTNFEQAWLRSPDQLHPIAHTESVLRTGPVQLGWNGTSATWDEAQLRVYNESRLDWMTFTTSKPIFGQRFFEVSELSNMLYLANKRFVASYNGTPTTDSKLFNGEFETPLILGASSTFEVNVDFTEGLEKLTAAGITYPQGYIYINFYYVYNDYDSIKVEVVTASGTTNISSTVKNIATRPDLGYKVLRYWAGVPNNATDIRVTFYTNTGNCWPTEISYTTTRFDGSLEEPFLNKTLDNKLHTKLTFRDKVGDRQNDNGTLGQILMSKVDSVEWADFSDIPGIYTYITNISDSVATTADTDTDEQYFDSIAIVDDTLNISIIRDGVPLIRIDLKPYLDDTDTDDQYFDVINITDDTLNLSIFDDGLPTHRLDLKPYLDLEENTDIQYIDTLYFDMDTLYISLIRDGVPPQKVYLGDLISMADSDKQRHDTAFIENNIIFLSLQRDSIPAHQLDLTPYLDDTDDQTVDQFDIVSDILSISLEDDGEAAHTVDLSPYLDNTDDQKIDVFTFVGTTLSVSNEDDGEASKTVDLSGLVDNWFINGLDDAFGSTDIGDAETVTFAGTGGVTAKLSFDGSNTMVIDGAGLQWILQAQSGTSQVIGDAASEIVEIVGAGNASTSILGNTLTITVPADVDNYVDALTFSNSTFILTAGRTGALSDLTDTIMDHDWHKVGTALPPNNTEDARRNGLTGIGMDPVWLLDVAEDARIYGHQVGRGGGNIQTNLRVGYIALQDNTTGFDNTAIGAYALENNIDGSESVAVGAQAMQDVTTGSGNVAIGNFAMGSATGGNYNVAIGYGAFERNTTGVSNNAVGFGTLAYNTTGNYNTAFGDGTMIAHKSGTGNVAVGVSVLKRDTVGILNVAMGQYALERMVNVVAKSSYNTSIGTYAGRNMYGIENVALGIGSMRGDTVGAGPEMNYTIALGAYAAHSVIGLQEKNIAIGYNSMGSTPGATHHNIAIGELALNENDGDYNVVIGAVGGGSGLETGDYNTIIGSGITFSANDDSLAVLANGLGTAAIWMKGSGNTGMGTSSPTQRLHVAGSARVTGAYYDSNNEPGTAGQVLSSLAGAGTDWVDATSGGTMSYFFINGNDDAFGNTQVDQGEVITIDGTGGITASLAASGSLSYVIDGSGITGTTNLSITNSANPGLNSSNGSDVIFQDGTGIDAVYVNDFTIRFNATDASITNEIQSLSFGYGAGQSAITISGDPSTLYMYSGTGITFSGQTGTTMTINANDVAANNEGFNGVGTGGPTSSTITTNTTGGNPITINVAGTLSISETTSANGGTINLTGTGGSGTVTSVGLTGTTGIGVTGSPITTSGTFALSLNNDLAALEALAGTGIAVRTGAATWANQSFSDLATGFTSGNILYAGGDGTPDSEAALTYNAATNTLTVGTLIVGSISASPGSYLFNGTTTLQGTSNFNSNVINMPSIPTYASDAAAGSGGLASGRIYRTSTGEVRIKL